MDFPLMAHSLTSLFLCEQAQEWRTGHAARIHRHQVLSAQGQRLKRPQRWQRRRRSAHVKEAALGP